MNIYDDDYFNWLNKEIDKNGSTSNIGASDEKYNRSSIEELFEYIDEYVKEYHYYNVKLYGYIYNFRHNDDFYEISKAYGPNILYTIKRNNNASSYIDIDDIKLGQIRGRENLEVCDIMDNILYELTLLNNMNVPLDSIKEDLDKKILSLKRKCY